ncbi:MBL fold metallo-hydrolase [[Clostridium] hylemonae]|uniref:MBL fold metallo-hydrolase n=1 Tax=[Clostridium] hylemonae TaxID=89153 RepID=UPI0011061BA8|nr:MBL fold metallo-hydrolase [[Clostridium] hylemonae]
MEICNNVHQIRINFNVTDKIERYVYIYLITGRRCYLIDTGTAGCEAKIGRYMEGIGRRLEEVAAVFLTHAHPDHIGSAAALKRITGCKVYAPEKEKAWIENIDLQFKERPIPNFYALAGESVSVDEAAWQGHIISPETDVTLRAVETPGHSAGSVSYVFEEEQVIFTGDTVPAPDDLPIITDVRESIQSIQKLRTQEHIQYLCPAWDRVYEGRETKKVLDRSGELLDRLRQCVIQTQKRYPGRTAAEKTELIKADMGWGHLDSNPLFAASIKACIE